MLKNDVFVSSPSLRGHLCTLLPDISLFCIFVTLIKAIHHNLRPVPVDVVEYIHVKTLATRGELRSVLHSGEPCAK